jgi:hypothetical protein
LYTVEQNVFNIAEQIFRNLLFLIHAVVFGEHIPLAAGGCNPFFALPI